MDVRQRVLALVIAYNSSACIEASLSSLALALDGVNSSVVVVDNASSDGTTDRCHELGVEVISNHRNLGFARAANVAFERLAGYDFVLIANPDTVFERDSIRELLRAATNDETVGSVGPQLMPALRV